MKTPRKAFVLAAGFGTRLLPLTRETPKPLLPIWNVPNLERILAMLRGWGVRDVLVNIHHRADRMFEYLRARPVDELRIAISFEPEILGTGGALRKAEWFFEGTAPVWVINGDIAADLDPRPLLRACQSRRVIAAAWVHGAAGPRTVEVARGRIVNFRSKQPGARGTFTFCGAQLVNPKLLDPSAGYLKYPAAFESLIDAYERAQADGWHVAGVESPNSFWADIGTPAQLLACHRALAGGAAFVAQDPTATVHPSATVTNSIICAGATLGPHAQVSNAIIAPGTHVNTPVRYLALPARAAFGPAELAAIRAMKWQADAVTALPLGPRGSSRTYTRIAQGDRTAMLVHYDPARVENTLHAGHTRFLRTLGVSVPRVRVDRPKDNVVIFENLGDDSLLHWQQRRATREIQQMYARILRMLVIFHEHGAAASAALPLSPAFGPRLYKWERDYFAEELLRKRERQAEGCIAKILHELSGVERRLSQAAPVLLHRDLQSSNIFIRAGRPWFIDYQGMRLGPAVYDLASLLYDPYVELPESTVQALVRDYAAQSQSGDAVTELFYYGAIQRLIQALGAYAKLGAASATRAFAQHIPAARRMLARALRETNTCPALRAWSEEPRAETAQPPTT